MAGLTLLVLLALQLCSWLEEQRPFPAGLWRRIPLRLEAAKTFPWGQQLEQVVPLHSVLALQLWTSLVELKPLRAAPFQQMPLKLLMMEACPWRL
jgi:hypothetical protein